MLKGLEHVLAEIKIQDNNQDDEFKFYQEMLYIQAPEAYDRIFEHKLHFINTVSVTNLNANSPNENKMLYKFFEQYEFCLFRIYKIKMEF